MMNIGGYDLHIDAPPGLDAAEIIIKLMRFRWPAAFFQDADEERFEPIDSPDVLIRGSRSREFFVFPDRSAAESLNRDGVIPENSDLLLHFVIGPQPPSATASRQVTLVCGRMTEAIQGLAADLAASFRGSRRTRVGSIAA